MSQAGKLAPFLDGIRTVASSAERDTLFPSPDTHQCVRNLNTGFVERWDGANWVQGQTIGSGGPVLWSTAFGAKADGTTDDTTAIQAACTAAPANGALVIVPPGSVWNPSGVVPPTRVLVLDLSHVQDASSFTQSAVLFGNAGELLRVMMQGGHAGGLRRDAGTPTQGGRVYVQDELWVEDPAWFDEDVQITSGGSIASTTLTATPAIGAKAITVASVPSGWIQDITIHLENGSGQIDRPRITTIVGTTVNLDSGLEFAHSSGDTVTTNPWKGCLFPINSWNLPGGSMQIGVDRGATKAATNPQSVSYSVNYVRVQQLIHQWFSDALLGSAVSATSGMVLSVALGTALRSNWSASFLSQNVTVTAADPTNPRIDLVVVNLNGAASVIAGVPAGSPVAPTPSASQTQLAQVAVAANAVSIVGGNITDVRKKWLHFNILDDANAGLRIGSDENQHFLSVRAGPSNTIVEAFRSGSRSSIDLAFGGGSVTVGGGTATTKIFHGQTTLVGGTKVVNTAPATSVSANTKIFLTVHTPGGTPGWLQVSARSAGTSFTILSSSGTDTSVVDYLMVEP